MAAEVSFLTLPHPSPSTDAAFHRESHQGRDARAGGGSPPRPQLRRHRAGTRTRLPPLPSHRPVDGDERQSFSFLGQALWRSSPLSGARRFATRSDPSAAASTNRSCSASSAKAPASPPRCSSPWVRPLYPPADAPLAQRFALACALSTVRGVRTVEKRPSVAKKNVFLAPRERAKRRRERAVRRRHRPAFLVRSTRRSPRSF